MAYEAPRIVRKIILVRHGESVEDVDDSVYDRMPDNKVPLTKLGREQAKDIAVQIAEKIAADRKRKLKIFFSPGLG